MDKLWVVDESVGVGGPGVGKQLYVNRLHKRRNVRSAEEAEIIHSDRRPKSVPSSRFPFSVV